MNPPAVLWCTLPRHTSPIDVLIIPKVLEARLIDINLAINTPSLLNWSTGLLPMLPVFNLFVLLSS